LSGPRPVAELLPVLRQAPDRIVKREACSVERGANEKSPHAPRLTPHASETSRGLRRGWPHGPAPSDDPGLLTAELLWRTWWELRTAGRGQEAQEAMSRIWRHRFDPAHLLMLWGESHRAREPELAAAIFKVIELLAAEEDGRVNSGAWSEPEPTRVEARREDRRKEPIL
jgi:hypothetical protein